MKQSSLIAATVLLLSSTSLAIAHDAEHFSAGEPGNPKKFARIVTVVMTDDDGAMRYSPDRLAVKKGEQVRFIIQNKGVLRHEFTLASVQDNNKHAEIMKKYPDMEHDDPNGKPSTPARRRRSSGGSANPARSSLPASSRDIARPACTARSP
jgi:uncharacterized cupredoxin-like copper-binding protein